MKEMLCQEAIPAKHPAAHLTAESSFDLIGIGLRHAVYWIAREPVMSMPTSLRALCCQPGSEAT
jgi:hypothetical protein